MSTRDSVDSKLHECRVEDYDGSKDAMSKETIHENGYEANTPAERKLVRKIDLFLLPCIWIVYLLSYMDRSNLANARVAGMGTDLEIDDRRYYLCVVAFQIGYVIAEIPCNMILSRSRPSIFIPVIMVLWGSVCAIMACAQTWQQLVGLRFLLGVAEAGFSPAVMFIVSSWYRRGEQSKRFLAFHSAGIFSGAVGSILAGAITGGLDGSQGIEGWRWLYIVEGVITVVAAFPVPFILLGYPLTSKRLSEEERALAYDRLVADGITSRNDDEFTITHTQALRMAFSNWRLYPLMSGYMIIIGNMTLSNFYPTFVMSFGYNKKDAQYMTAPLYGTALVVAIVACVIADKVPRWRAIFTMAVLLVFGTVFCALTSVITAPIPRYVFLCFINTAIWCGNPLALSYTSTVLGLVQPEVRAISLASINGAANLAQLYATEIITVSKPPVATMGFQVFAGLFAIGALIYLACFFIYQKWPYKSEQRA